MDVLESGIYVTADGSHSLISEKFKESYHSRHGALKESLHVFIEAGLKNVKEKKEVNILEIGLGTGLNAWLTLTEAKSTNLKVNYTGLEPYPIDLSLVKQLNYVELTQKSAEEVALFEKIHATEWDAPQSISEQFTLSKHKTKLEDFSSDTKFDICYFDAFAPNAQPELWTDEVFKKIYDLLAPNGYLVTYCAKGSVKRSLKAIGFTVEALEGPPGKREMTRATKVA